MRSLQLHRISRQFNRSTYLLNSKNKAAQYVQPQITYKPTDPNRTPLRDKKQTWLNHVPSLGPMDYLPSNILYESLHGKGPTWPMYLAQKLGVVVEIMPDPQLFPKFPEKGEIKF